MLTLICIYIYSAVYTIHLLITCIHLHGGTVHSLKLEVHIITSIFLPKSHITIQGNSKTFFLAQQIIFESAHKPHPPITYLYIWINNPLLYAKSNIIFRSPMTITMTNIVYIVIDNVSPTYVNVHIHTEVKVHNTLSLLNTLKTLPFILIHWKVFGLSLETEFSPAYICRNIYTHDFHSSSLDTLWTYYLYL